MTAPVVVDAAFVALVVIIAGLVWAIARKRRKP